MRQHTHFPRHFILLFLIISLSVLALSVNAQEEGDDSAIPQEIADHLDQWPLANRGYDNTRSANSTINSDNVGNLGVAWEFAIPGRAAYGAAASNPLVIGEEVYFQDLASNVFRMNLDSGDIVWEHTYDESNYGPNGPAVGWGKVFVPVGTDKMAALDAETGDEIWSVVLSEAETEGIDIQPTIYGGIVYTSTVPGTSDENWYTGGVSGIIYALDEINGEILWKLDTDESGNLWGNEEVNSGGGVWYTPAVDPETGSIFFSIANPAPWPGTEEFPNASSRPGPNLYTNTLMATDYETGEIKWFNQVYPHEILDHDLQLPPILSTTSVEGEEREMVFTGGKMGEIYAIDRNTGETVWTRPVGEHYNSRIRYLPSDRETLVLPGPAGGIQVPMAMSEDGIIYATTHNLPGYFTPTGFVADRFSFDNGDGEFVAVDNSTGAILWTREFDNILLGGATVVNDLVFTADWDGVIYALDRQTGETVWSYQAPAGINAWPAVVEDTIIWPAGVGENATLFALRLDAGEPVGQMGEPTEMAATDDEQDDDQQWISVDEANQTVTLTVIASYDDTNGGLNFNGYADGEATFTVPEGWTVNVVFSNESNFPHSAMVVGTDQTEVEEPSNLAFEGASIPDPASGFTGEGTLEFSFSVSESGSYALVCGVPTHAQRGHWIRFEVGSDVEPAFTTGDGG